MKLLKFLVIAIAVICGQTVSAQSVKKVHMITELKADTTLVLEYPKGENITSFVVQMTAADPKSETKEEHICLWETQTACQTVVIRNVSGRWTQILMEKAVFLSSEGKSVRIVCREKM